jgi:uncharacterized membrane protein
MKQALTFIFNLFSSMTPAVRTVLAVGTVAITINDFFNVLWAQLFAKIDALSSGVTGTNADFSACGFLNYVFPLDTVCTLMSAYAVLTLSCATIRIIKSFIPSIA